MDKKERQLDLEKKDIKLNQDDFYNLLLKEEFGWQALIYDLINTEQLDPWDINLSILAEKYIEKIEQLEEANFIVSSKILLAAALLLRIKTEILLNHHIRSLDEILYGKKEEKKQIEKIEFDDEIPDLIPKTPLPRHKKVSLQELMSALNKAISTEQRRIQKKTIQQKLIKEAEIVLPKRKINIRDKIKQIYSKLRGIFKEEEKLRITFSSLTGKSKEEKILTFLPLLHLDTQQKVWLEQENHFDEIYIWLKEVYLKEKRQEILAELDEAEKMSLGQQENINQFENPLANFFDMQSEIMKGNLEEIN